MEFCRAGANGREVIGREQQRLAEIPGKRTSADHVRLRGQVSERR